MHCCGSASFRDAVFLLLFVFFCLLLLLAFLFFSKSLLLIFFNFVFPLFSSASRTISIASSLVKLLPIPVSLCRGVGQLRDGVVDCSSPAKKERSDEGVSIVEPELGVCCEMEDDWLVVVD